MLLAFAEAVELNKEIYLKLETIGLLDYYSVSSSKGKIEFARNSFKGFWTLISI